MFQRLTEIKDHVNHVVVVVVDCSFVVVVDDAVIVVVDDAVIVVVDIVVSHFVVAFYFCCYNY